MGGRLVASSIDLYVVVEYVDGGDLFSMKGAAGPPAPCPYHTVKPDTITGTIRYVQRTQK